MNPARSISARRWRAAGVWVGGASIVLALAGLSPAAEPSLQERIDAAEPGQVVEVGPGRYAGNLVIDKPLVLRGKGQPHLEGSGVGKTVRVLAPGVTVEGFRISHSGLNLSTDDAAIHIEADNAVISGNRIHDALHGIYVRGASGIRIENNEIRGIEATAVAGVGFVPTESGGGDLCAVGQNRRGNGIHFWNSQGNVIRGNRITESRDGIYFSFTRESRIEANTVTGARYGLHYMYSDLNHFSGNHFESNVAGAALMFSKQVTVHGNDFVNNRGPRAYGLVMHNVDASYVHGNRLTGNRIGIYMQNSHVNELRRNELEQNYTGMRFTSSSTGNRFAGNRIGLNLHNIDLAGRNNENHWSEGGRGNQWLGATAMDLNGDGVSEIPHRETDLLGGSRDAFPLISLLTESPALKALQFALQRAPLPDTHYITDEHPLIQRPQAAAVTSTP